MLNAVASGGRKDIVLLVYLRIHFDYKVGRLQKEKEDLVCEWKKKDLQRRKRTLGQSR